MPRTYHFFTLQMAQYLRAIRKKSRLTQEQVARRLGFSGRNSASYIARLENGLVRRPYLDTIVQFLHACGARMRDFAELLDQLPPLAEVSGPQRLATGEANSYTSSNPPPAAVQEPRAASNARRTAEKYERRIAYPRRGTPPAAEQRRRAASRLRDYYCQRNIIRQDIYSYLADTDVPSDHNLWYFRFGARLLTVLRREQESQQAAKMAEIVSQACAAGLDPKIMNEVRQLIEARWRLSFAGTRKPSRLSPETKRFQLLLTSLRLRGELYDQARQIVLPLLRTPSPDWHAVYPRIATECYQAWLNVRAGPRPGRAVRLAQAFSTIEEQAKAEGLEPDAVNAVLRLCARKLKA